MCGRACLDRLKKPTRQFFRSPIPKISEETRSERRAALIGAAWSCASRRAFRELTIDDICAQAGLSKGAFYGYFSQKQDLLLALLDDDVAALDEELDRITRERSSGVERLRGFAEAALARGEDPGRVQFRADLWAELMTDEAVRQRLANAARHRRELVREWIEEAIREGEVTDIPANALASILLALADGLMLHGALDPGAFRWKNIRRAIDVLLTGIIGEGTR